MKKGDKERMIINSVVFAVLVLESVADIKTKSISIIRLMIYFTVALTANLILGYQPLISMLGGIVVGIVVLVYGFITHEGIGYGDGILFVCLGAVLGMSENLRLLFFSLLAISLIGGIYAIVGKKGIKVQIPFVPCILGTFIVMNIVEAVI